MLLGTAIARLQDEAQVEETLAALDDWVLMARMRSAADAAGLSLSDFASAAVRILSRPRQRTRIGSHS